MQLLSDRQRYLAGSSHRMAHCGHKGLDMLSNNIQVRLWHLSHAQVVLRCPECAMCPAILLRPLA